MWHWNWYPWQCVWHGVTSTVNLRTSEKYRSLPIKIYRGIGTNWGIGTNCSINSPQALSCLTHISNHCKWILLFYKNRVIQRHAHDTQTLSGPMPFAHHLVGTLWLPRKSVSSLSLITLLCLTVGITVRSHPDLVPVFIARQESLHTCRVGMCLSLQYSYSSSEGAVC